MCSPHVTCNFNNGYAFLPHCEDFPSPLTTDKYAILKVYWGRQGWPNEICRWVKLHLPNGQTVQSVWYESNVNMKLRQMSCVEFKQEIGMCVAEVLFYFYIRFGETQHPLAMISMFSLPDREVLSDSSGTIYLCEPLPSPDGLAIIPVKSIILVISMFPDM
ncbi:hypothetical protein EI94DRAFT_1573913 [Lactarius quietus]|nr:hypothetical protein EI94DRAFT_1573913 [Lactarius quietus]